MLDLDALRDAVRAHRRVARIVVAGTRGSTPREAGAAMLVWAGGSAGTIGGGRLELDAVRRARAMLAQGPDTHVARVALGPALGQCCGGAVVLVTEIHGDTRLRALLDDRAFPHLRARPVEPGAPPLPDSTRRRIERLQAAGTPLPTTLTGGWLIEPVRRVRRAVFIYGAGHVGPALARLLAPLPQFEVVLCDTREDRFDGLPAGIRQAPHASLSEVMDGAPDDAAHVIMTHDHDQDLALCHHLLGREFALAGLIGSATKRARFHRRLAALGHAPARIARIRCPIGDPALGKHPQAIAVGVAAALLRGGADDEPRRGHST